MLPAASRSAAPKPQSVAAPMTAPSMDRRHHPPRADARVGKEIRNPVMRTSPFWIRFFGRTGGIQSRIVHRTLGKVISYVLIANPRCQPETIAARGIRQGAAIMDRMDEHYPSLRGGRVIVTGSAYDFGESIV